MSGNLGVTRPELKVLEAIAEAAATAVGRDISQAVREELRQAFQQIETQLVERLESEFGKHFGKLDPDKHIEQHTRIDKFFAWVDGLQDTFWKTVITRITTGIIALVVLGYYLGHR